MRSWDSCFTAGLLLSSTAAACGRAREVALPAMDDAQAGALDRPVRHLRLRRLRALHHLVPGRHRHHGGGRGDPRRDPAEGDHAGGVAWRRLNACSWRASVLRRPRARAAAGCWPAAPATSASTPASILFREGEPANEFFLIRQGTVALETARAGHARRWSSRPLGEGEIVGASWLVPPYRWSYDARAVDLDPRHRHRRRPACATNARPITHLGYEMMKRFLPVLVQRLQATRHADARRLRAAADMSAGAARSIRCCRDLCAGRARAARDCRCRDARSGAGRRAPCRRFAPGQFNMLYAFGVGEVADQHQRRSGRYEPASCTRCARSARSAAAIAQLEPGDVLGLRGPFGSAWPVARRRGRDVVIVAGGLGLAPLRPAIYHVLAERERLRPRRPALRRAAARRTSCSATSSSAGGGRLDVEVEVTVDHADADWHGTCRRGARADRRGRVRSGQHGRDGLRAGGDDALRRRGAARPRAWRPSASTCRWSAT